MSYRNVVTGVLSGSTEFDLPNGFYKTELVVDIDQHHCEGAKIVIGDKSAQVTVIKNKNVDSFKSTGLLE